MNVLGAEIDLADYMSPDMDEPDSSTFGAEYPLNKSYRAFVQTAYNSGPKPAKVKLPVEKEGRTYAEWYFRVINPYLPMLHKPSFLATVRLHLPLVPPLLTLEQLSRFYDHKDDFEPSTAETVMVHMMFAIMYFQYASRNAENASHSSGLNDLSNRHYHYALSFFPRLMASHTLQDVQALTMISLHLRSFPKPGACWMLSATTLNLAIELGLHRSAKRWAPMLPKRSFLEIEMRKRIFWSIYTIHTIVGGKLGRPMALRHEDFDVEIPQAVDDELLTAEGIDNPREGKCGFLVGIESIQGYYALHGSVQQHLHCQAISKHIHRYSPSIGKADRGVVRAMASRVEDWRRIARRRRQSSCSIHECFQSGASSSTSAPINISDDFQRVQRRESYQIHGCVTTDAEARQSDTEVQKPRHQLANGCFVCPRHIHNAVRSMGAC